MMANPNNIDLSGDNVIPISWGLVYCIWCAPSKFTAEEVGAAVTAIDRPGTSKNQWVVSEPKEREDDFNKVNHLPCPDDPNRTHWLLNC